jgi:hypothetical protein
VLNAKKETLPVLFDQLLSQNKSNDHPHRYWDKTALLVLKITRVLLNNHALVADIAVSLSLIIDKHNDKDEKKQLWRSLVTIEKNLPRNKQGFSSLMLWALEDLNIRLEPSILLMSININQRLKQQFLFLCQVLLVYQDLTTYWSINNSSPALVFLVGFKAIQKEILSQKSLENSIAQWLRFRVKNQALTLEYSQISPSFYNVKQNNKNAMLTKICIRIASGGLINAKEQESLSLALETLGLMDLTSLVDNGFLILADAA